MVSEMTFPSTIVYGKGAVAWRTEQARTRLWSSPVRETLVQYLDAVRVCYQSEGSWKQIPYRYYLQVQSRFQRNWWKQSRPDLRKVYADWLVYGGCERQTEMRMMYRLISAMLERGASIVYLVRFGSAEHECLCPLAEQYPMQMKLVDLYHGLGADRRRLSAAAVHQAWKHFCMVNDLVGRDLRIPERTFSFFLGAMVRRMVWERLKPFLVYERLLVRNHFGSLESVMALDALLEGKPVVTLQHGVISSSGFFPVLATTVLTFGQSSADFLRREDERFARWCNTSVYARRYIPVGSLFDEIHTVPEGFDCRTILLIDQYNAGACSFYGLEEPFRRLPEVVLAVAQRVAGARIILRLHPSQQQVPEWVKDASANIVISQGVPLHEDLARSTLAVGLFSGALTVAAASGVPTFFLWEPGWFYTPDLSCFANGNFVSAEEFVERAVACLISQQAYQRERQLAMHNAEGYYAGGRQADFKWVVDEIYC